MTSTTTSTGYRAPQSGIWASACHNKQLALSKGDVVPPCGSCHKGASYKLVQATN